MEKRNKLTKPNKLREPYIDAKRRYLKKLDEYTYDYRVRFPPRYGINAKLFTAKNGGLQHAINWRNQQARCHRINIEHNSMDFNFEDINGKGKSGTIVECRPNIQQNFEYRIKTDDGQGIRREIHWKAFDNKKILLKISRELGIEFNSSMFRENHPELVGRKVHVRGEYDAVAKEVRIKSCRPLGEKIAEIDKSKVTKDEITTKEEIKDDTITTEETNDTTTTEETSDETQIEMIPCNSNLPPINFDADINVFTPEQQYWIHKIIEENLENVVMSVRRNTENQKNKQKE